MNAKCITKQIEKKEKKIKKIKKQMSILTLKGQFYYTCIVNLYFLFFLTCWMEIEVLIF